MQSKQEFLLHIPARCEIIKYINVDNLSGDVIILPEEICEGIFVASAVASPKLNKIPIKILNVREDDVDIKNFRPKIKPLSDYKICAFESSRKTVDRVDKILDLLQLDHLEQSEKFSIQKICSKFSDVFYLDNDQFTTTNIYKQKIHLQQGKPAPVYDHIDCQTLIDMK